MRAAGDKSGMTGFRTIKICPKDAACIWRHSRPVNGGIPLKQRKGHVMRDMTLKTDQERQGWTQPSDIAWAWAI